MRSRVLIILFSLLSFASFGKKDFVNKNDSSVRSLVIISDSLQKKYIEANNKFISATDQLELHKAIIGSFGTIYTIITIIIALMGIALPILTYQFGIKPSRQALSDFEKRFEEKIDQKIAQDRRIQIEQAFLNIKGSSNELKFNAVNFLSLTAHQGFEDSQLFQIYNILETVSLDVNTKITLSYLLTLKENGFALKYFADIMKAHDVQVVYNAVRYYCFRGIQNFAPEVKDFLSSGSTTEADFFMLLNYANAIDPASLDVMINNQTFVDALRAELSTMHKAYFLPYLQNLNISANQYQNAYFYQFLV